MEVTLDDFRRHFGLLSDVALLDTDREELVESARQCFDEEVSRRGLNAAPDEPVTGEVSTTGEPSDAEQLVLIATYSIPDEANLARGLLASAEIPFQLNNDLAPLGGFQLRLLVPAAFEADAREVLESQISDEELAAQAEAAGAGEDDIEEES
jgi:hypothetical protein